jgi:uncharacterized protein
MQDNHQLRDDFLRALVPDLSAIKVPMLVCGSFSDNNLHSRGSIRAFTHGGSTHARLYAIAAASGRLFTPKLRWPNS